MGKKIVALSFLFWAITAVLGARPASALLAVKQPPASEQPLSTYASFAADYESAPYVNLCEYNFYFRQRINVENESSEMVLTDIIYGIGVKDLYFIVRCGDYNIYGAGSCGC